MADELSLEILALNIETLIFSSDGSLGINEIKQVLHHAFEEPIEEQEIVKSIRLIQEKYNENFALELVELNGGYQFLTKKNYYPIVNRLQIHRSKKKLSQSALETLAIIAYREPITKPEIEQIRGVNCDYTIQKLLEKELITITGKSETVGKPLLYSTGVLFMDYFGIKDKSELPKPNDISGNENAVGNVGE